MAIFSVADFRARVRDLAKQYMFEVEILFPVVVGSESTGLVNILAQSASVPGREIAPIDVPVMGQQFKMAGEVTYPDWTVTFRIDDNYDIYKKMRSWSELIRGSDTGIASFPIQYKSNPKIYQIDAAGNRLNSITMNGAWPTSVGEVAVDWTSSEIQTFDVTWAYDSNTFAVE